MTGSIYEVAADLLNIIRKQIVELLNFFFDDTHFTEVEEFQVLIRGLNVFHK
jgi:hypothetical protein